VNDSNDGCPICGTASIEVVATFGPTAAGFNGDPLVTMHAWRIARCEGCKSYLRRTEDSSSGLSPWEVEAEAR
jgi:hypothetical protein